MKERLKRKKLSSALGILVILALFVCVVAMAAIIYVITDALYALGIDAAFMQYAQYVLLIVIGVLIVRRYLTEYEYALDGDELTIDRYIGQRERNLLCIKTRQIVSLGKQPPGLRGLERLTFKSKKSGVIYMVYTQDGAQKAACFSPSDELLDLIEKRRSS